jgi:hypothetical protein
VLREAGIIFLDKIQVIHVRVVKTYSMNYLDPGRVIPVKRENKKNTDESLDKTAQEHHKVTGRPYFTNGPAGRLASLPV